MSAKNIRVTVLTIYQKNRHSDTTYRLNLIRLLLLLEGAREGLDELQELAHGDDALLHGFSSMVHDVDQNSRGDRYLSHSSHHTQVPVPVTNQPNDEDDT